MAATPAPPSTAPMTPRTTRLRCAGAWSISDSASTGATRAARSAGSHADSTVTTTPTTSA